MIRVVIESPYAGDVKANVAFAQRLCRFACERGYAPIASHLLYTQFLDDNIPEERSMGIEAGLAWASFAEEAWFALPDGRLEMSAGMKKAHAAHESQGRRIRYVVERDGALEFWAEIQRGGWNKAMAEPRKRIMGGADRGQD